MAKDIWASTKEEIREYMVAAGLGDENELNVKLYEAICGAIDSGYARILRNKSFLAKVLGSSTSKKKSISSRENGKKGGRPKTKNEKENL